MQIRRRPPNPAVMVQQLQYQVKVSDAAPRHILEEIVWHKEKEVEQRREVLPLRELQRQVLTAPPARSFLAALQNPQTQPALIAEVKKASPSKGVIRENFDPVAIAKAYQAAGATCLSVLTDQKFFQGSYEYMQQIRAAVDLPLLCKDFIIYPYQMYFARLHGADAVLLIAAILPDRDLRYFIRIAQGLGMRVLIEVHTLEEMDRVLALDNVQIIGINNRNLEDFSVDIATTERLLAQRQEEISAKKVEVISESGLHSPEDIARVSQAGATAVLIGESLMRPDGTDDHLSEGDLMEQRVQHLLGANNVSPA